MAGTPLAAGLTIRSFIHLDMAGLYQSSGDSEKELANYKESIKIAEVLDDNTLLSLGYGSIADLFLDKNIFDTALYYAQLDLKHSTKSGYHKYKGSTLSTMGRIYFKQGDYKNSKKYYTKAIRVSQETGNTRNLGDVYLDLSELLLQIDRHDSSLYYARKGLLISEMTRLPRLELKAFKMLTKIFANIGMIDSAYFYQNAAIASSESMFSEEKIVYMQNYITF